MDPVKADDVAETTSSLPRVPPILSFWFAMVRYPAILSHLDPRQISREHCTKARGKLLSRSMRHGRFERVGDRLRASGDNDEARNNQNTSGSRDHAQPRSQSGVVAGFFSHNLNSEARSKRPTANQTMVATPVNQMRKVRSFARWAGAVVSVGMPRQDAIIPQPSESAHSLLRCSSEGRLENRGAAEDIPARCRKSRLCHSHLPRPKP